MKKHCGLLPEHLRIFIVALTFGGIWGLLEATLGTLLHLLPNAGGLFFGSATVMLPIACFLLGAAYKETGKARTLLYVGLFAAGIKLFALFLPTTWGAPLKVIRPAVSIVLEASCFALLIAVVHPDRILSKKGIGIMIGANLLWPLLFLGFHAMLVGLGESSKYIIADNGALTIGWEKLGSLLLSVNWIANGYSLLIGGMAALIFKALKKKGVIYPREKIRSIIFHPVAAPISAVVLVALAITANMLLV